MPRELSPVEKTVNYIFQDPELLSLALTHSSYVNESDCATDSNERLEFLGDAVLELTVSEELFARFPEEREGHLTRLRARMVKEASLASLARRIGLQEHLYLGKGEEAQGGRDRDALLADAVEALVGAVFLDSDYEETRRFVLELFTDYWPENVDLPRVKDYKTKLQEITQQTTRERPVYSLVGMRGPDHAKIYKIRVSLPGGDTFNAEGGSKKKAEQIAARQALEALGYIDQDDE